MIEVESPLGLGGVRNTRMSSTTAAVVLLVQADADNRAMYAEFLRHHGFLPIPVSTASDAMTAAPTAEVIVTSILLPGHMDGIEFINRLKSHERTKRIPVIVLTTCAWNNERERAEKAGCDVFLAKPSLPEELLREVRRLLASSQLREARGTTTKADLASEPDNRCGLVADSTLLKRSN